MSPATATAPATTVRAPRADDEIQPVAHETRDRIITGALTVIPFLMLGFVVWQPPEPIGCPPCFVVSSPR
jgi:hypothetical protein